MPVYEYECQGCEKVFEVQQKIADAPLRDCPACGSEVKKLVSMSSFQLKGQGWYSDGYSGSSNGRTKEAVKESGASPCGGGGCANCPAASV